MQKFKESITINRQRADGSKGFLNIKKGRTPESYGLTPGEVESVKSQLVEFEGVTATTADESILDRIAEIIHVMLMGDPKQKKESLWTKELLPRVEFLEHELKIDITTDQRDEAWANFKEEV